ncbi:dTDP-4-dehydrorhamnose 3,5-epimerase [Nocardia puris]|uniref:dTDP-4-dehydrorhamnose 3,5-epimerase n=1 Tax=Nocardia puris TaxID=208602 RepID=A0A366DWF6_9NOCA|nr:dTDP-4-dehydrorhamnose 3,5-epimerase [Nocardia puris]
MTTVRIESTDLDGVALLIPDPAHDERGLFTRTFDVAVFDAHFGAGASGRFVQDSQSRSRRGVVRGMHGRRGRGEAKLVRCAAGAILDIVVDIRPGSPTFGRSAAFRLDDENFHQLYIPPGFLHGFQALTERADVCYRIDRPHDPADDLAVRYDDPDLALPWPEPVTLVSARDRDAPSWRDLLATLAHDRP